MYKKNIYNDKNYPEKVTFNWIHTYYNIKMIMLYKLYGSNGITCRTFCKLLPNLLFINCDWFPIISHDATQYVYYYCVYNPRVSVVETYWLLCYCLI